MKIWKKGLAVVYDTIAFYISWYKSICDSYLNSNKHNYPRFYRWFKSKQEENKPCYRPDITHITNTFDLVYNSKYSDIGETEMTTILVITYILNCMSFLSMLAFGFIPQKYKKLNKVFSYLVVFLVMGTNAFVILSFYYIWLLLWVELKKHFVADVGRIPVNNRE